MYLNFDLKGSLVDIEKWLYLEGIDVSQQSFITRLVKETDLTFLRQ